MLSHAKSPLIRNQAINRRFSDEELASFWRADPCARDVDLATKSLTQYFIHADAAMLLRFVPERIFKSWAAETAGRKTSEDLMVIYSMLALGSVMSESSRSGGSQLAQVAYYAQRRTRVDTIQAVQGRLLLAAYHAALCNIDQAALLVAEAGHSAASLELNLELDQSVESNRKTFPFGMNRIGYSEARRRTFWALFVFERLCGIVPGRPSTLKPGDIQIRLPMDTQSFEQQVERDMPFFNIQSIGITSSIDAAVEVHSALIKVVYLWGECQQAVYSMTRHSERAEAEGERLHEVASRTALFYKTLCPRLVFSPPNLETACYSGNMGALMMINALFHQTMARANRYHLHAMNMPPKAREIHLEKSVQHSRKILAMMIKFEDMRERRRGAAVTPLPLIHASVEAADILSGSGKFEELRDVLENLHQVRTGIEALTEIWDAAPDAAYAIGRRMSQLDHIGTRGPGDASPGAGYKVWADRETKPNELIMRWSLADSLDHQFPKHMDIVYCDF